MGRLIFCIGNKAKEPYFYQSTGTKVYTMEQGEWHHVLLSRDAKVLVVENADTGPGNTEYRDVARA